MRFSSSIVFRIFLLWTGILWSPGIYAQVDTSAVSTPDSLSPPAADTAALEHPLYKWARQYQSVDLKNKKIVLYDQARIKYGDIELEAGIIVVDYAKKEVIAGRIPDSTGKLVQRPKFSEGKTVTENDSIRFNFETKKALVWNTFTREGEISLISEITKKVNDSVNFFKNLKITTAEDIRNPEYYILATKGKVVPGKKIVVGPSIMYIEEIPTPLILPFGYFPLMNRRTSGIIIPTWNESARGFGIQNLGLYLVLGPRADFTVMTDIYTNGSYAVNTGTQYVKRYAYSGRLNFRTEKIILGEPGMPDYVRRNIWNLTWVHNKDPKSDPRYNFGANVNIGSSKYYRTSYNIQNLPHVLNNTFNSSVSFSTRLHAIPLNLSVSATHNQNVNTEQIRMSLPEFYAKLDRIYPFAPRSGPKKNILHRLNFDYTYRAANRIETTDAYFLKKEMWETARWGMMHQIPLSTNFKLLRYFNFTPSASFRHVYYGQHVEKYWDPVTGQVKDTLMRTPAGFTEWTFSTGMHTVLYGIFKLGKKIKAVRHVMQPSLSYSYTPAGDKYVRTYQASPDPADIREYTPFEGGMFGQPGLSPVSLLTFRLSNTFEAKIRQKDGEDKKIALIKNLNFGTSYNFKADSLKLGLITMTGNVEPIKGLPLRLSGIWDPYAVDSLGRTVNQWAYKAGQGWVRLKQLRLTTSFRLSDSKLKKWLGMKDEDEGPRFIGQEEKEEKKNSRTSGAYRHPVRWNVSISYNLTFQNKNYFPPDSDFKPFSPHTLNFTGNIEFSPGWKVGFNSGYDLVNKGLTYTMLNFRRDLKSWYMTFTWRPLPPYTSWYFYIGIKASVLQDIKYEKRKEPFTRFF
ncbi:MAG: LPS-assembly protein LptD [Chlorobi bacterium]|nr:LPS-assembly protein LptD [Chlorobiota bacterium]